MLKNEEIGVAKGFLKLGHKQHDVAAHFGVNAGRIAEIAAGKIGGDVPHVPACDLPPIKESPRFFTSRQSLQEQEEILSDLIEKPGDAARVYLISPELAESILNNRNSCNRSPSAAKISEYIDAMSEGRWPVTGATIVFSKSGYLLDGQHRLLACVRSGLPLKTYVVFGIDDGAFTLIDIGRKRTNIDAFAIAKIPYPKVAAKATRWLVIFENDPNDRGVTLTNDDALRWYNDNVNKALMSECVRLAVDIEKATRGRGNAIPSGSSAALLYLFAKRSRKHMNEFSKDLSIGRGPGRAILSIVREATERSGGRIHEVYRNAIIVLAWNAFRAERRITKATLNWDFGADFPEIN